jgi:hypothetical protein
MPQYVSFSHIYLGFSRNIVYFNNAHSLFAIKPKKRFRPFTSQAIKMLDAAAVALPAEFRINHLA